MKTKIILAPCVSEKSTKLSANNTYVFKVCSKATKPQIAAAIKALFAVEVKVVRIINVRGKGRKFSNIVGRRKDWKKAYITLAEGQVINFGGA
jgi:large subunit ribosomal protein L23